MPALAALLARAVGGLVYPAHHLASGGFVGAEVAATCRHLGLDVTVVDNRGDYAQHADETVDGVERRLRAGPCDDRLRAPAPPADNLRADLPDAALLVYITRSEGLGSAALLAMAYGVPVVAIGGEGAPGVDIETTPQETAGTFTPVSSSNRAAIGR